MKLMVQLVCWIATFVQPDTLLVNLVFAQLVISQHAKLILNVLTIFAMIRSMAVPSILEVQVSIAPQELFADRTAHVQIAVMTVLLDPLSLVQMMTLAQTTTVTL
jgi:hypothetical protein